TPVPRRAGRGGARHRSLVLAVPLMPAAAASSVVRGGGRNRAGPLAVAFLLLLVFAHADGLPMIMAASGARPGLRAGHARRVQRHKASEQTRNVFPRGRQVSRPMA